MAACAVHEEERGVHLSRRWGPLCAGNSSGVLVRKALLLPPAAMALTTGCCPPRLCTRDANLTYNLGLAHQMKSPYPFIHSRYYDACTSLASHSKHQRGSDASRAQKLILKILI